MNLVHGGNTGTVQAYNDHWGDLSVGQKHSYPFGDEQPITLGISDDFWTVVTSGLKEGDQIVMDVTGTDTSSGFGNFRAIGGISGGGSFGRGGRPPTR